MHGLGNNYIYIDLFQFELEEALLSDIARKVSDVNTGIGSDGMILIHPTENADLGMRIFNKDGSEGQSCGNGLRCTAKYAYEHGIVDKKAFTIETRANIVESEVIANGEAVTEVTINMGPPRLRRSEIPMLGEDADEVISEEFLIEGKKLAVTPVWMGNPNAVFIVDKIEDAPLYELGGLIEKDPRFPERANVEFIEIISENEINFRVWERGSGVTQACGTGACASVVAAIQNRHVKRDEDITVHLAGGDLTIKWDASGDVWMTGGADVIASGNFVYTQS